MKKILTAILLVSALFLLHSCQNYDSYAGQKDRERSAISSFLERNINIVTADGDTICKVGKITVIDEETFERQDSTTNLEKNEYVLFAGVGVYMQIVRKGVGKKLAEGESARIMVRFLEFNINGDSLQLSNNNPAYSLSPEYINASNDYGTITASFDDKVPTGSLMSMQYKSTSVPGGWIIPLSYVNIGRCLNDGDEIARVRVIVPHGQGQAHATSNVYPCFYELTFQRERE